MKTLKNIIFVSIALMGISALAMQETSAELGEMLLLGERLLVAVQNGDLEAAQDLVKHGDCVINYSDVVRFTPLMHASQKGRVEIVKLLLEHRADVNAQASGLGNVTALIKASQNGHTKIVRLLLDKGANINARMTKEYYDSCALNEAALFGHKAVVQLLLDKGADVNWANRAGVTPLVVASTQGHLGVLRLLLDRGANVDAQAQGFGNCTALTEASEKGHTEIVRLLLDAGANVDLPKTTGDTSLMLASQKGYLDVIKLLLTAISDEDAKRLCATIFCLKQVGMQDMVHHRINSFFQERLGRAHAMMSKKNNAGKDAFDLRADSLGLSADSRDDVRKGNMESLPRTLKNVINRHQLTFLNSTDFQSQDKLKALIESNMHQSLREEQMKALE